MRLHHILPTLSVGALLLVGASSCSRRKITECNSLIQVFNSGAQSLDKRGHAEGGEGAANEWSLLGEAMEKAARDASVVAPTVPELKALAADYQGMATEVAKAAREVSEAAKAKDAGRVNQAQAAMESALKKEGPIFERINKFCQSP